MGKRRNEEDDEEYIRRKIRKLERRLKRKQNLDSETEESAPQNQEPELVSIQEHDTQRPGPSHTIEDNDDLQLETDAIPEEFLLALGQEGEEKNQLGSPIKSELAARWTKLMTSGLGKEAKDLIIKKYPTPENFPRAIAPAINPEILSSLPELTLKRDKRIMARQNTIGHIMSCLGKALSSLLKGDINSKVLVEQINDAAKLAAEIHFQDSSSRKFFALAGANQTVKEALRNENPDEFLFGNNCAEKIKAAQAIQRTSSQIKSDTNTPKVNQKPQQVTAMKKQGNWRSPPQQRQQRGRGRGGHYQPPRRQYPHARSHQFQRDHRRQPRPSYRR